MKQLPKNQKTLEKEWNTLNDDYLKNEAIMSEKEKSALVKKIQNIENKFRTGQRQRMHLNDSRSQQPQQPQSLPPYPVSILPTGQMAYQF